MLAAENNHKEVVVELVRAGANVNEKNDVRQLLTYFQHHVNIIIICIIVCCCRMGRQLSCLLLKIIIKKLWLSW